MPDLDYLFVGLRITMETKSGHACEAFSAVGELR